MVNLDQLVKGVLDDLRHDTQGRNIAWTIGPLPAVQGDPAMLRQVFMNLVDNAVKYTRHREQAKIEIGSSNGASGETVVFVRDNGVGFDMQYVDKLFGVFQRLHSANEFEGTGIGLANVRRIVQRHGGRTWAEGKVDGGATIYFSLPNSRKGSNDD
jgi:light-regulated signal transduction histidine kinase (bacteriophytochrome)